MRHTSPFFNMRLLRNKLASLLIKNCCERLSLEEINCNRISTTCLAVSRFDPKLFVEPITRLEEVTNDTFLLPLLPKKSLITNMIFSRYCQLLPGFLRH